MMKKIFLICAALVGMCVASCNKVTNPVDHNGNAVRSEGFADINVGIAGNVGTKVLAQSLDNEKKIQNVQVFVFRGGSGGDAGNLDIAASKGFDTPLDATPGASGWKDATWKIRCSTGPREIWVVVNDSQDRTAGAGAVSTKAEFLLLQHELKNSSSTKLLMVGTTGEITLVEGTHEYAVEVTRYAASVILNSVKNQFTAVSYQAAGSFRVKSAYLLNVPGMINFGKTSDPASYDVAFWYAQRAKETNAEKAALIVDDLGSTVIEYGATRSTTSTFYTYPNACAASEDIAGSFTPRRTVLVLEAELKNSHGDWQTYYYPVILSTNPIVSNTQYKVDLIIHRPGSNDPNIPVKFDDVTPVITITDWATGDTYTPEI